MGRALQTRAVSFKYKRRGRAACAAANRRTRKEIVKVWHHELMCPLDERGLVSLANDFLASWTPAEVAVLPRACRPPRMRNLEDVHHWRHLLAEAYCGGAVYAPEIEPFRRMLSFFIAASDRAAQIQPRDPSLANCSPEGGAGSEPSRG